MSIQCKAYLTVDGATEATEIRSFRLDEGAASNYDYLRKKIATIFPNLGWDEDGSAFTLRWKDSTGDMITFSSDEELVDALGEVAEDGVFRVYINHKKSNQAEFPWQQCMRELWKSLNTDAHEQQTSAGHGQAQNTHPYSRPGCHSGKRSCGQKRNPCGPQRQGFPTGFAFNTFPFPGLHAEIWAFPNENECAWQQCCGQWQKQAQSQENSQQQKPDDSNKPSTSSSS